MVKKVPVNANSDWLFKPLNEVLKTAKNKATAANTPIKKKASKKTARQKGEAAAKPELRPDVKLRQELIDLGKLISNSLGRDQEAFYEIVIKALMGSEEAAHMVAHVARNLEKTMDAHVYSGSRDMPYDYDLGSCPILPELFLALNANEVTKNIEYLSQVNLGITSVSRFNKHDFTEFLKGRILNLFALIGLMTHGFKFFKYDAKNQQDSLLCKFGFNLSQSDKGFQRFTLNLADKIDPESNTTIGLFRPFCIISNPEYGSLIVRNSSFFFGRDHFKETALYSPLSITEDTMHILNEAADLPEVFGKTLYDILTPLLYAKRDGYSENMIKLSEDFMQMLEEYGCSRFDTRAEDGKKSFDGDINKMMEQSLELLKELVAEYEMGMTDKEPPSFAVFPKLENKGFYNLPIVFNKAGDTYLKVDRDLIAEIEARQNGTWKKKDFPDSQYIEFIKTALNNEALVALVDA